MRTATSTELEMRAADALRALLGRISGARLRELTWVPRRRSHTVKFVAQVEVFGHAYTLACGVHASEDASQLHTALRHLQQTAADLAADATPVLIAPRLSPEAQAICKETRVAFLDLEGNARLFVGEVFIVMRSLPCLGVERNAPPPQRAAAGPALPGRHPLSASREQLAFIA
jgi:hypothetical protein